MLQPTLGASSAGNSGSGGSREGTGTDSASRSSGSGADQPSVKERTGPTSTAAAVTSAPAAKVQAVVVATWASFYGKLGDGFSTALQSLLTSILLKFFLSWWFWMQTDKC